MWRDGKWISDDEGMTTDTTPPPVTVEALREAATQLRAVAESAAEDHEYATTLGIKHRQREQIIGGSLALEAVAGGRGE